MGIENDVVKKTLYITIGLPGSGKSTFIRKFIVDKQNIVVISKDDIRLMLRPEKYTYYKAEIL